MKNNTGFTLIELIVAVAVFSLVVSASTGLFVAGLRAQKSSLANQQLLAQTSYLMEYMSRAVRMAKKDMDGSCTGQAKLNYAFESQCLRFRNYQNNCQQFCLSGNRLQDQDGNYLTSSDLTVSSFLVQLAGASQDDALQPKATIFLEIENKKFQTTISQRNLDVQR